MRKKPNLTTPFGKRLWWMEADRRAPEYGKVAMEIVRVGLTIDM